MGRRKGLFSRDLAIAEGVTRWLASASPNSSNAVKRMSKRGSLLSNCFRPSPLSITGIRCIRREVVVEGSGRDRSLVRGRIIRLIAIRIRVSAAIQVTLKKRVRPRR